MKNINTILEKANLNNEPIFVLRANDKCSIAALSAYNTACFLVGVDEDQLSETQKIFTEFMKYQTTNSDNVKNPDL